MKGPPLLFYAGTCPITCGFIPSSVCTCLAVSTNLVSHKHALGHALLLQGFCKKKKKNHQNDFVHEQVNKSICQVSVKVINSPMEGCMIGTKVTAFKMWTLK